MTEDDYISELRARWPRDSDASLETITLADEAVRAFPSSARLWVVSTKRLLGIRESGDEVADMPKGLHDLMSWDREIFADFVVEPLTPYKEGVMQTVRVVSASKIVVTEKDKVVLRKDKL